MAQAYADVLCYVSRQAVQCSNVTALGLIDHDASFNVTQRHHGVKTSSMRMNTASLTLDVHASSLQILLDLTSCGLSSHSQHKMQSSRPSST